MGALSSDSTGTPDEEWLEHSSVSLDGLWESAGFRLVEAFEVVAPPGWSSQGEALTCTEIWLVRTGSCAVADRDGERRAGPGQLIVVAPGAAARNAGPQPLRLAGFAFTVLAFGALDLAPRLELPRLVEQPSAALAGLVDEVTRAALGGEIDRAFRARALAELAFAELAATGRADAPGGLPPLAVPADVERILEHVAEHYGARLDLAALASAANLSPKYVARRFKEFVGIPPMAYVRHYRLGRANELLTGTDLPITQIALATGFADHAHFSRAFRARYGLAPRAARARSRARQRLSAPPPAGAISAPPG